MKPGFLTVSAAVIKAFNLSSNQLCEVFPAKFTQSTSVVLLNYVVYNFSVEIAILLHLYQPVTQSEEIFRTVYKASYLPLLTKIGRLKDFHISLDLPLSLLEQMDRYGYQEWISDMKDLVRLGKVELVGSAAYHPLLPKLSKNLIERQIILNEYSLGYYLGAHQNLEGESALMIKNIRGFFPPEMAVNENTVSIVDSLGYSWMVVDETAIPEKFKYEKNSGVYSFKDYKLKLIVRNRAFSNILSFKRDTDLTDIREFVDRMSKCENDSFVVVLDGEFLGHHFDQGFLVLERMLSYLRNIRADVVTVSDYLEDRSSRYIKSLNASSWGASEEDMAKGDIYPMWDGLENEIHKLQWGILESLSNLYDHDVAPDSLGTGFSEYPVLPIWDPEGIKSIHNPVLKRKIAREVLLQKSLHSDQFWWASRKQLSTGDFLFHPAMVRKGLQLFEHLAEMYGNKKVQEEVNKNISAIGALLDDFSSSDKSLLEGSSVDVASSSNESSANRKS